VESESRSQSSGNGGVNTDLGVAVALLVFCGATFYVTTSFREVPAMLSQNVPATFFPRLVLAAIAALSVAVGVAGLKQQRERRPAVPTKVIGTGAIFIVTVTVVQILGMLTAVCLVAIAMPVYWGERRPLRIALLAICLPVAIYLVFVLTLGMRLPTGVFG